MEEGKVERMCAPGLRPLGRTDWAIRQELQTEVRVFLFKLA